MSEGLKEFDETLLKSKLAKEDPIKGSESKSGDDVLVWVKCVICHKKFQTPSWTTDLGEDMLCSQKCAWEWGH